MHARNLAGIGAKHRPQKLGLLYDTLLFWFRFRFRLGWRLLLLKTNTLFIRLTYRFIADWFRNFWVFRRVIPLTF